MWQSLIRWCKTWVLQLILTKFWALLFMQMAKLRYSTLGIVPYVPLLNCCHLSKETIQQTALIYFFFFPLPLVWVFFPSPSQKLQFRRKLRSHRHRQSDALGDVKNSLDIRANESLVCEAFDKPPNQKGKPPMRDPPPSIDVGQ